MRGGPDDDLAQLLRDLGEQDRTGCLRVANTGTIFLRDGAVRAAQLSREQADPATRLAACGLITGEALAEARRARDEELTGWTLGELLVHLGHVDPQPLHAAVAEFLLEAVQEIVDHREEWRFRPGQRTREVGPAFPVGELLGRIDVRRAEWMDLLPVVLGPDAIVSLRSDPLSGGRDLTDTQRLVVCAVDGARDLTELALTLGLSRLEVARAVAHLVRAELLAVEGSVEVTVPCRSTRGALEAVAAALGGVPGRPQSLTAAFRVPVAPQEPDLLGGRQVTDLLPAGAHSTLPAPSGRGPDRPAIGPDPLSRSLAALSEALACVLPAAGPAADAGPVVEPLRHPERPAQQGPQDEGRARSRRAAAADLAAAFASASAGQAPGGPPPAPLAQVVDLAARRAANHAEELKAEQARAEELREEQARAEEQPRAEALRAEQAQAEALRAEQAQAEEQVRAEALRAEQAQAEEQVRAEALRAEQAQAEEQVRAEALRAEQAQAEEQVRAEALRAEQAKAEEQARAEALRAEQAQAEEQVRAEALRAEQAKAEEQARAEALRAEQAQAEEQARAEALRAEQTRAEEARAEQARAQAERARVEHTRVEQLRVEALQAERVRAEQVQAEAARALADRQAVAVGAGTTRIVGQASPPRGAQLGDPGLAGERSRPAGDAMAGMERPDTAALLRELSNLGLDDEPAPIRPPAARTAPPSVPSRNRRKSLFSR